MKAKLSNGYTSELVVLETASGVPISNVVLLFPMKDREAMIALRKYLDSTRETIPELERLYEQCEREWKHIDKEN